jgi:hypothetical protein
VERLALAEQADVQLLAGVALDAFGQHLGAQPGDEVEHRAGHDDDQQHDHDGGQLRPAVGRLVEHGVEGVAHQPRDHGVEHDHDDRADEEAGQMPRVAQLVGQDPSHRPAPVVLRLAGDGELGARQCHRPKF